MQHRTTQFAFSLVELSIVLVILGLLTGGILGGQALIRAAEMRAIGTDLERYQIATHIFRDKYFALPGDMSNAYAFFSTDPSCTTNTTVTATNPNACNGNGNGLLDYDNGEMYEFWYHLSISGLIEGKYSGWFYPQNPPFNSLEPGRNAPFSKAGKGTFFVAYNYPLSWRGYATGDINSSRNRISYGELTGSRVLNAGEAWNIDKKLDDGKPGSGNVTANISCATTTSTATAEYNLLGGTSYCGNFDYALN